jgi:hypothetical protein
VAMTHLKVLVVEVEGSDERQNWHSVYERDITAEEWNVLERTTYHESGESTILTVTTGTPR